MKYLAFALLAILLFPQVLASHDEDDEPQCSITHFGTCIAEKFFEYIHVILDAPIIPFLLLIKFLVATPLDITPLAPIWAIVTYIISMFYGLFILFAGFNFIISGYSPEKREEAKSWLRNTILMVLFVQASLFVYQLLIELSSGLTSGVISLINQDFFLTSSSNLDSFAMELILLIPYLIVLLFTIILLAVRLLLVGIGVALFPIGIFFNFIPPLKSYGKLIINILLVVLFLPFFHSLMLLCASKVVEMPAFADYKFVLMIASFFIINISMIFLVYFALMKAANSAMNSDVWRAQSKLSKLTSSSKRSNPPDDVQRVEYAVRYS